MFIGAGIGGAWTEEWEQEAFFSGYGDTSVDREAIVYYRLERFIEDVAEYTDRLLVSGEGGPDREVGLHKFIQAFDPGNVVEIAIRSSDALPS